MLATIYLIYGCLLIPPTLANLVLRTDGEVSQVGSTVTLNCSLEAFNQTNFAPINITWYHNETTPVGVGNPILDATSSALVLHNVQFDDSGTYSCSLIEAQISARINIKVGLPPEPATALKCASTNFENANCTWNRGGQNSNLPTKDIVERMRKTEWKVCTENSNGVSSMSSICNQTTCYVVCHHQSKGTSYRVRSTNHLGANYSKEICFNIDEETIPNPPSDVTVQNKSASSLLVTWTPDPGVGRGTTGEGIVDYFMKYRWEGDEDWSKETVKPVDKNAFLLTGLRNPYGLYYVKVKCSSIYQRQTVGRYSRVAAGRTSEIAPVDTPGNFSCFSETPKRTGKRNIILTWELLPNKYKRNGEIIDQIIRVRKMIHTSSSPDICTVGPNDTNYTLKDMELEEKYEISLRVRNSVRESANYSHCFALPIPTTGDFSSVYTVASVASICLFAAIVWVAFKFYKKVMRGFPDFQLPSHLGNSNLYFSAQSPHRSVTREKEVYDELLSGDTLFVELPPADEKTPFDSPGVSPGPNNNLAFSCTFDIGNRPTPQQAVTRFPPGDIDDLNIPISPSSPTDREAHRHRHWSSDTCTSSLNSPISVGSGGSYFVLRESDSTSYCVLAKDGFSPNKKNNLRDPELSGAGSSAAGWTPSCLDLENDSDGEVSILGLESRTKNCKFCSPERVLYKRKHALPNLTDPEASQARLIRAATDSPVKSRDTVGFFGLDEVTEEQEVESLGSRQEDDDDTKGKGGREDEDEDKEAGRDLGLAGTPEKLQDANEDDGIDIPPEKLQDANKDDAINIPPEKLQDANEDGAINIPPEKLQDANEDGAINVPPEKLQDANEDGAINIPPEKIQDTNEDDGIKIPSENAQTSADDFDKGGGANSELLVETASSCRTDQPDFILNYITVCKDDEGADEEDFADGEVKTETGEDEISIAMGSSSDTSRTECPSSHMYLGSTCSNGAYIDQVQLANISPVSSPTRSINHHDFSDPGVDPGVDP